MGDAFKNAGLVTSGIVTVLLGIICLHSQRLLVNSSKYIQKKTKQDKCPDYADTVELCFINGPISLRKYSGLVRMTVNIFICLTQLGFCCVYIVFVSDSLKQVNIFMRISI